MKLNTVLLSILLPTALWAACESRRPLLGVDYSPKAWETISKLMSQGFDCNHAGSAGTRCTGPLPNYPKRVSFIIPNQLERIDEFNLHLLGHNLCKAPRPWATCTEALSDEQSYLRDLDEFSFESMSKRPRSILLVPETANESKTYLDTFASSAANFDRFIETNATLLGASPTQMTLSGHSGAYIPMGTILNFSDSESQTLKQIQHVALVDGSYSDQRLANGPKSYHYLEHMVDWSRRTQHPLDVHYVNTLDSGTRTGASIITHYAESTKANAVTVLPYLPPVTTPLCRAPLYRGSHFDIAFSRLPNFFSATDSQSCPSTP